MKRSYIREILEAKNERTISFAGGLPDEELFPVKEFELCMNEVLKKPSSLQYSESQGLQDLRALIAHRYTQKGFKTSADEILITTGSQQALNLISLGFLNEGVNIETPSYLGALGVFNLHKVKTQSLKMDREGVLLQSLATHLKTIKAAYLIPDFQNPTGLLYSKNRRKDVAKMIKEQGALLVEDGAYEELYFEGHSAAISRYIPDESLHIGSFSKILAPGLRLGWIRGGRNYIDKLLPLKEIFDLHSSTLDQALIIHYLKNFDIEKQLEKIREKYSKKMHFFASTLRAILPSFEFEMPKGGMFIYGSFKDISTCALARACMKEEVLFVPGIEFYFGNEKDDEIRFNFTAATQEECERGVYLIKKCLLLL